MSHLKSYEWILAHLQDDNVRIIDCRFLLHDIHAGEIAYKIAHLPNAHYVNLEKDLSGQVTKHGGRHPLPNLEQLAGKLSMMGIDSKVTVVAYDDQKGANASRLWWMLQYLGHNQVYVMNGSYSDWEQKGFPIDNKIPVVEKKEFKANIQSKLLATVEDVRLGLKNPALTLIDSREEKRYKGIEEPIDKIAGHIPGAKHLFWMDNLNKDGSWNNQAVQEDRFQHLDKNEPHIVYCGSGVTACPNVLALQEVGFTDVKLYLGSWSDWISYEENEIEKE